MNSRDTIENPSKTLDISVMDIFSPINLNSGKNVSSGPLNQSKVVSFHSTPKFIISNSESVCNYEDSFMKKILSPLSQNMAPASQSSPYLCPINEVVGDQTVNVVKTEPTDKNSKEEHSNSRVLDGDGGGDGFHVDNVSQRNLHHGDIIGEIKNSQKEILNEISSIKKEVNDLKFDLDNKFKILQENYESISELLRGEIKQEIYAGNCDSKIEHISQRILINELNKLILSNGEQINEEIKLNAFRLKHIYEIISGVK